MTNSTRSTNPKEHKHTLHKHERRNIETPEDHINHCFDYLRQAIMCAGDTTLEKAIVGEDGQIKRDVEGWDVEHQCRDYNAIYAFATENHAHNETGID
jgi:hypothetical protein